MGHVIKREGGSLETFACVMILGNFACVIVLPCTTLGKRRRKRRRNAINIYKVIDWFFEFQYVPGIGWMDGTVLGKEMDGNLMINNI